MNFFRKNGLLIFLIIGNLILWILFPIIIIMLKKGGHNIDLFVSILILIFLATFGSIGSFLYFNKYKKAKREKQSPFDEILFEELWDYQKMGLIYIDKRNNVSRISSFLEENDFSFFIGKDVNFFKNIAKLKTIDLNFNDRIWQLTYYENLNFIFVLDKTNEFILEKIVDSKFMSMRVKMIVRDIELYDSFKLSAILNDIWVILSNFFKNQDGFFIETFNNTAFGLVSVEKEKTFIDVLKTSLKKIELIIEEQEIPINYAVGLSFSGKENFKTLNSNSLEALQAAETKGINQIAMKKTNKDISFLTNGYSDSRLKSNLSISFVNRLYDSLMVADKVFISTHSEADLDAFGSVIGMYEFVKSLGKEAKIFIKTMDKTTFVASSKKYRDYNNVIIDDISKNDITSKSVLIVTDVSKENILQKENFLNYFDQLNIFIIDHHEAINNEIDIYECNKFIVQKYSSASEMVTELIRIFEKDDNKIINDNVANILLSGIFLDTNYLQTNANEHTFNTVGWLVKNGGEISSVKSFLEPPKFDLEQYSNIISNIKIINNHLISFLDEKYIINNDQVSIFADELLEFKQIYTVFFVAKIANDKFKASLRKTKKSEINIVKIAERLHGGGKENSAAIEFKINNDEKINSVIKKIEDVFQEEYQLRNEVKND